MLENEFKWYLEHQDELVSKYNGRIIVIVGNKVVGDYATKIEAYNSTKDKYEPGTFLVQSCSPGNTDYTQTFHSRVAFTR